MSRKVRVGKKTTDGTPLDKETDMPRKNYTPAERALHILGALAGIPRQELNDAIAKGDVLKMVPVDRRKELPESSLDMLKRRYIPSFTGGPEMGTEDWEVLWEHCTAPKKAGDL